MGKKNDLNTDAFKSRKISHAHINHACGKLTNAMGEALTEIRNNEVEKNGAGKPTPMSK